MSSKQNHTDLPAATFLQKLTWQGIVQYVQYHIPRLLGKPQPIQGIAQPVPLQNLPTLRCYKVNGVLLEIYDYVSSGAACHIARELNEDCYNLEKLAFAEGDVVIDIGGHVGIFAIYLAKQNPDITIYSYEPIPDNFRHFQQNIAQNCVKNIHVFNQAVTQNGRSLPMTVNFSFNSGGATAAWDKDQISNDNYMEYSVESVTLNSIFQRHQIDACRLLKLDCEGSEYEILLTTQYLDRIQFLSAEFHTNDYLQTKGYSPEKLFDYCRQFIPAHNISYMTWDIPG